MPERASPGPGRLTARQRRFVDEYLVDVNATQAAVLAGYSKRTARQAGQRMLTNVDIAAAIITAILAAMAVTARFLRQLVAAVVVAGLTAVVRMGPVVRGREVAQDCMRRTYC